VRARSPPPLYPVLREKPGKKPIPRAKSIASLPKNQILRKPIPGLPNREWICCDPGSKSANREITGIWPTPSVSSHSTAPAPKYRARSALTREVPACYIAERRGSGEHAHPARLDYGKVLCPIVTCGDQIGETGSDTARFWHRNSKQ
jgi:hypothetical protein